MKASSSSSDTSVGKGTREFPSDYVERDGFRLGQWVGAQRGRRGDLSDERVARLSALPGWVWGDEDRWQQGFDALQRFVELRGDARVPSAYQDEDGRLVGRWVVKQRAAFKRGDLSDEQDRTPQGSARLGMERARSPVGARVCDPPAVRSAGGTCQRSRHVSG